MTALVKLCIRAYQVLLSPVLRVLGGPACGCRFYPSCSNYCLEAIEKHGLGGGISLGARRLARCHPWGGSGFDPVPEPEVLGR
jgi:putative membrane protein insertion efficiency factor